MSKTSTFLLLILLPFAINAQAVKDTTAAKDTTHRHTNVGFAISGNVGGGIAAADAGMPDVNHITYNNLAAKNFPNANYTSSAGINVGFDLDLLFTRKRNIELSIGLTYTYSSGTVDFCGYHVEYEAQDGNGNAFRRLLTATSAKEQLTFGNVSIPILFKYSTNPDKKLGAYFQLGPVVSLSSSASGTMNATIDFEGIYHYNSNGTFTYSSATTPGDWVITRQAITSQLGSEQSATNYFNQLYARKYYVGLDKTVSGNAAKVTYNIGGGMMIRAGGEYRATKIIHILFGISALFISNSHSVSSYTPITASNDLNSISLSNFLNGTSSLLTMQVGVNLGLQVRLLK